MGIAIIVSLVAIGIILIIIANNNAKKRDKLNKEVNDLIEIYLNKDKKRNGSPLLKQWLSIPKEIDKKKIGYIKPQNEDLLVMNSLLLKGQNDTVRFFYPYSPVLYLVSVEFNPQYKTHTSGTVSGKTGSSIVGGALLGNAGATIGSSGRRKIDTTSTQEEVFSIALLTFVSVDFKQQFAIETKATSTICNELIKDFMCSQKTLLMIRAELSPTTDKNKSNKDEVEELKQYKELMDQGILTQDEFDAKKKQILGL